MELLAIILICGVFLGLSFTWDQLCLRNIIGSQWLYCMQRALKMAGVEFLIMGFWKVPDAASSEDMSIFYQDLFKNKNIETSYQNAQKDMTAKYPHDVEKWGGFVLVEEIFNPKK